MLTVHKSKRLQIEKNISSKPTMQEARIGSRDWSMHPCPAYENSVINRIKNTAKSIKDEKSKFRGLTWIE